MFFLRFFFTSGAIFFLDFSFLSFFRLFLAWLLLFYLTFGKEIFGIFDKIYENQSGFFWEVKTVAQKISKFWEIAIRVFNLVKQTRPGEQDF